MIFVVDSSDRERITEARSELHQLLETPELKEAKVLVFANKQDLPNALTVSEITHGLDMNSLGLRKWFVQAACGNNGEGLYEGLEWLSRAVTQN